MQRKQFTFYRSYWEVLRELNARARLTLYDAIAAYALDGTEPALTGPARHCFLLIRPTLDTGRRRSENGFGSLENLRQFPPETPAKPTTNPPETTAKPPTYPPETTAKPTANPPETTAKPTANPPETTAKPTPETPTAAGVPTTFTGTGRPDATGTGSPPFTGTGEGEIEKEKENENENEIEKEVEKEVETEVEKEAEGPAGASPLTPPDGGNLSSPLAGEESFDSLTQRYWAAMRAGDYELAKALHKRAREMTPSAILKNRQGGTQ